MRTIRIHHNHIKKILGAEIPVETIALHHVQRYLDRRAKLIYHGQPTRPTPSERNLQIFRQTWLWGLRRGKVISPNWEIPVLELQKDEGGNPSARMARSRDASVGEV